MSDKNDLEEDYFARVAREKKEQLRAKIDAEAAEREASDRKSRFHNKCGKCGHDMFPKLFKGVEIDVCSECGAVLLDPGELQELAGSEGDGVGDLFGFFFGKK